MAAPEALSRFYIDSVGTHHTPEARIGAAWMTREDREHEIRDYVAYLDALAGNLLEGMDRSAVRLVAFGFSQGVATVTRWAARGGTRVDRMILWAGSLPEDLVLAEHRDRFGAAPVTCVFGDHDEFFNDGAIARQQGRMRDAGIPFAFVRFGGGHTIDPQTLERLATPAAFGR